jgi:hypothetical protein
MTLSLTPDLAERFADIAMGHVEREFPHKMDHVMSHAGDVARPRELHPVFFGSFDWHSCVHGYWLLARLTRRFPGSRQSERIMELMTRRLSGEAVAIECAYLERPDARGFERPYGWAWLLALQAELDQGGTPWALELANRMRPLALAFADRFRSFLPLCSYPVRTGVHSSTAFALRLAADYAERSDPDLFELMKAKCLSWYLADRACQAWEPSQDDFLSPTLMEAECMRRFLDAGGFRDWFTGFLPEAGEGRPDTLFRPAVVTDRTDGKIAHLDGLNFARAWCWRSIAGALEPGRLSERARAAALAHLNASLPHVAGDYAGEHWLATFATLALEA